MRPTAQPVITWDDRAQSATITGPTKTIRYDLSDLTPDRYQAVKARAMGKEPRVWTGADS